MLKNKWFLSLVIPLMIVCVALDFWFMYYSMFLSNNTSIVTSYVDDATYSEEEKYFIDVEYFSNENENGIENFGVKFNYYTDVAIPEKKEDGSYGDKYMYSSGVQFKNGLSYSNYENTDWFTYSYTHYQLNNCFYYNTDNGTSFAAVDSLKNMNHWVYDIKGQLCLIEEIGEVHSWNTLWVTRGTCYDTSMFMIDLYNVVKTLPDGENVVLLDLSKYYKVYLFNGKEFDKSEVSMAEEYVFIQCHITKSSNGLASAGQSMFKSYQGDTNWTLYGDEESEHDYWQSRSDYTLSLGDFNFIIEDGKYLLKLQDAVVNYLKEYKNFELYVDLDLDNIYLGSYKLNVDGFAKDCFAGFNVAQIKLQSTQTRDFYVFEDYNIQSPENVTIQKLEVANA